MYTVDGQQACTARSPQGGLGVVQARRPVRAFNPSTLESLLEHCTPAAGSGRMERLILHAAPDVQNTDLLDMLARQLAARDLVCAMTLRTPFLPKTATLNTLREAGCNRLELTWPTAEDLPLPGLSSLPLPPRISVVELTQHAMDAHIRIPVGRPGDSSSTVLNLLNMAIGIPDMIPTLERPLVQIGSPLYRVASSGLPNTHLAETHGADTRLPGLIRNRQGQLVASPGFPPSDLALLSRLEQLLEPLQHAGLTSIRLVAQALKQKPTQILDALLRHTPLPRPPRFQVWLTKHLSHVLRDAGRTEQLPVLIQVLDLEFWRADFQQRRTRGLRPGPLLPDPIPPQALLARNPAVEVRTFSFDLLKVMALGMEEAAHRRTHLLLRWQGTGVRPLISILPDRICEQLELLTSPRTVAELREEARERGWETMDMNALRAGPEGLVQQGLAVFRGIRREKARPLGKNVLPFQMQGGPRQILPFRPRARKHEPPVVQPPSPSEEKE